MSNWLYLAYDYDYLLVTMFSWSSKYDFSEFGIPAQGIFTSKLVYPRLYIYICIYIYIYVYIYVYMYIYIYVNT